jgi:hypothetical protein
VRREEYDSRVEYSSSSSSTPPEKRGLDAERLGVGMATRNERDLPAYVRVVTGTGTGGGASCEEKGDECVGGEEDGRVGRDGVRSKRSKSIFVLVWLSMNESVFERASMRFASFVGEDEGDDAVGVIDWNIPDRSFASLGVS